MDKDYLGYKKDGDDKYYSLDEYLTFTIAMDNFMSSPFTAIALLIISVTFYILSFSFFRDLLTFTWPFHLMSIWFALTSGVPITGMKEKGKKTGLWELAIILLLAANVITFFVFTGV